MKALRWFVRGSMMVAVLLALPGVAAAHCDGLDGPVVTAARKALESGDLNPVLIWVQPSAEAEIKQAFNQTVSVRKLSAKRKFAPADIAKGRAYVASYVGFLHYVEAVHEATTANAQGHYPEK